MKQVSDKIVLARIKEIRTNKGLSQEYIANQIGLKQSGYNLIENGNNELSVKRLLQIAIAMDVDCVDLMSYPIKYIKEQDVDLKIEQIKRELEDKKEIILGYKM